MTTQNRASSIRVNGLWLPASRDEAGRVIKQWNTPQASSHQAAATAKRHILAEAATSLLLAARAVKHRGSYLPQIVDADTNEVVAEFGRLATPAGQLSISLSKTEAILNAVSALAELRQHGTLPAIWQFVD